MQRPTTLLLMLMPALAAGWAIAGPDAQTSSSATAQKKTTERSSGDKEQEKSGQATGSGFVSGLAVGGANSASSVKMSPGAAVDSQGRKPLSTGRQRLPDPRSER